MTSYQGAGAAMLVKPREYPNRHSAAKAAPDRRMAAMDALAHGLARGGPKAVRNESDTLAKAQLACTPKRSHMLRLLLRLMEQTWCLSQAG